MTGPRDSHLGAVLLAEAAVQDLQAAIAAITQGPYANAAALAIEAVGLPQDGAPGIEVLQHLAAVSDRLQQAALRSRGALNALHQYRERI